MYIYMCMYNHVHCMHVLYLMQGHIGDPEVALGVYSESVGHVELGLPPGTLRGTNTGELE